MTIKMKDWFNKNKWFELYKQYHVQKVSHFGKVIDESEKAYKCEVECFFNGGSKTFTLWIPKSCVEA